jgi:D-glycero-D-manno-heptose 1,7-bisphosphate phosphatase
MDSFLNIDGKPLIDDYFYSPFHVDGVIPEYTKESDDRKPGIGMIERAIEKYDINLKESFLIGDSLVDMKSAENAGIRKILVKTGYGTKTHQECINYGITIDYYAEDLGDASTYIEKLVNIKLI